MCLIFPHPKKEKIKTFKLIEGDKFDISLHMIKNNATNYIVKLNRKEHFERMQ